MSTLPDGDALWRGIYMGASNERSIHWETLRGLTSVPVLGSSSAPPERIRDFAMPGWADVGWRSVEAFGLQVDGDAALDALVASMMDRHSVYEFRFHDESIATEDLMVAVQADRCEDPRDASTFTNRSYGADLRWIAGDPTIYSADATEHTGGAAAASQVFTWTNGGRWESPSGRAWTLEITASTDVQNPYVTSTTNSQTVTWQGLSLPAGQTLNLDEYRISRRGSLRLDSYAVSGASRAPEWPTIALGANSWTVGCSSGTLTATLTTRDTY